MQGEVGSTFVPFLRTSSGNLPSYGDRFIPCRSSMDMNLANYLLTEPRKGKENKASVAASPAKEAYRKLLYEALMNNRTRIFSFGVKPPEPPEDFFQENSSDIISSSIQTKTAKQRRHICQVSKSIHNAPGLWDNFCLNLMDWGSSNLLSIALENSVYLFDASKKSASRLMTVDEDSGPVTSVSWAPDGRRIAIGLCSSDIQLWDTHSGRLLRTLKGAHQSLVGSLAWNGDILTTGGSDGMIVNNDVRQRSHIVQTYREHRGVVCGLKWSDSGKHLASGGSDNLLLIWDISMASLNPPPNPNRQWLYRFQDHTACVKALAWCPFKRNLLASGGSLGDRCIKFWNINTGACLNSVDTGSQVCALLWNKNEQELLSSHGYSDYKLTLWKYPSMVKFVDLKGHISRVLFMAQSPDGCMVASAAGGNDETLRIWNVFEASEVTKPASKKANSGLLTNFNQIR